MRILGIDPGSRVMGYGLITINGTNETYENAGSIHLDTDAAHQKRLQTIYQEVEALLDTYLPDACAVEMPVYGRNPQSMLKLGRAQAAAMLPPLNRTIPVTEYTPKAVKKSVTGNGNASKQQVAYMVCAMLSLQTDALGLDATDAIAVALCHAHRHTADAPQRHTDWASFLRANPDRQG